MKAQITRIITGVAIVGVGLGFLLDNLNIFDFGELAGRWWPMTVILVGLLIFLNDARSYLWALLVTGFGVLLQLKQLDITTISPWQFFWPVAIIIAGLSVLMNRSAARLRVSKADRDDATAILGGSDFRNTSDDFKGSKVSAILGGVKLDLRKAKIKKEATIEVFSFWGGVELVVPRDVVIKNRTAVIMGGVDDKTEQEAAKGAPVLYITGDVIMAGVEIKN